MLTKQRIIVSRWLGILVETSKIMSRNSKHLSDDNGNKRDRAIITKVLEVVKVGLQSNRASVTNSTFLTLNIEVCGPLTFIPFKITTT